MHKWPFYPALYPPWKVPQPSPGAWWLTPANASGKAALLCSTSTAAYFARTDHMTSPAELADRVEGAKAGEQREMLRQTWCAIHSGTHADVSGMKPGFDDTEAQANLRRSFRRKLDAEAFESAAIMLVPKGHGWKVRKWAGGGAGAGCYPPEGADDWHSAATPALALCAAALRAMKP